MRTVSLEMAKKLKKAGLQHRITDGDWYLPWLPKDKTYASCPSLFDCVSAGPYDEDIWLPTLPDLLEWLEGRGYLAVSTSYLVVDGKIKQYACIITSLQSFTEERFYADTREDAAANAVLWVLEQEGRGSINA